MVTGFVYADIFFTESMNRDIWPHWLGDKYIGEMVRIYPGPWGLEKVPSIPCFA